MITSWYLNNLKSTFEDLIKEGGNAWAELQKGEKEEINILEPFRATNVKMSYELPLLKNVLLIP